MNEQPKKRWGCLEWGLVVVVAALVGIWLSSQISALASRTAPQMIAVRNAKQIIIAVKQFAAEHDGFYPDVPRPGVKPVSSNQVFRRLFREGIVSDEGIFGTMESILVPDGDIGEGPGFAKALMPGECAWMLLKNQADTSPGNVPLIIENSLDATFPPRWDVSPKAGQKRGRAWKGTQIVIGRNDGAVEVQNLRPDGALRGERSGEAYEPSWFDRLTPEEVAKLGYWDVEER